MKRRSIITSVGVLAFCSVESREVNALQYFYLCNADRIAEERNALKHALLRFLQFQLSITDWPNQIIDLESGASIPKSQ